MKPTIASVEAFWDRQPCNIKHSKKEVGTQAYFDEVSLKRYTVEPHIKSFAEFDKWNGKTVLEIGCGIGTDAAEFIKHGAIYTGVDLSKNSIDIAKQRIALMGKQATFIQANTEDLSAVLPDTQFDLIYSFGVLHHTPNMKNAIQSIRKHIKPDGEFRFMVYAKDSWKAIMINNGLDQPEAQAGCPIADTFTVDNIVHLLHGTFEVNTVYQDHLFMYDIPAYNEGRLELAPWFAEMPAKMRTALAKTLGWHLLVTAKPITIEKR